MVLIGVSHIDSIITNSLSVVACKLQVSQCVELMCGRNAPIDLFLWAAAQNVHSIAHGFDFEFVFPILNYSPIEIMKARA